MRHLILVSVFAIGLVLRVSTAAGAMEENNQFINTNNNNNNNAAASSSASASVPVYNTVVTPEPQRFVQPAPNNNVNNTNVVVGPNAVGVQKGEVAYGPRNHYTTYDEGDAASVLGTHEYHAGPRASITPMIGGVIYGGGWKDYVNNTVSLGVAIDIPVSYLLSFELEGGYARFTRSFLWGQGRGFDVWDGGGSLKVYFTRGVVRPYVGAGMLANYYDGMMFPGTYGRLASSQLIGSGQLLGGAEISLSEGISIGARAAWIVPMINRPYTFDNAFTPAPGTADASMINTSFYKLMGTVSIAL